MYSGYPNRLASVKRGISDEGSDDGNESTKWSSARARYSSSLVMSSISSPLLNNCIVE